MSPASPLSSSTSLSTASYTSSSTGAAVQAHEHTAQHSQTRAQNHCALSEQVEKVSEKYKNKNNLEKLLYQLIVVVTAQNASQKESAQSGAQEGLLKKVALAYDHIKGKGSSLSNERAVIADLCKSAHKTNINVLAERLMQEMAAQFKQEKENGPFGVSDEIAEQIEALRQKVEEVDIENLPLNELGIHEKMEEYLDKLLPLISKVLIISIIVTIYTPHAVNLLSVIFSESEKASSKEKNNAATEGSSTDVNAENIALLKKGLPALFEKCLAFKETLQGKKTNWQRQAQDTKGKQRVAPLPDDDQIVSDLGVHTPPFPPTLQPDLSSSIEDSQHDVKGKGPLRARERKESTQNPNGAGLPTQPSYIENETQDESEPKLDNESHNTYGTASSPNGRTFAVIGSSGRRTVVTEESPSFQQDNKRGERPVSVHSMVDQEEVVDQAAEPQGEGGWPHTAISQDGENYVGPVMSSHEQVVGLGISLPPVRSPASVVTSSTMEGPSAVTSPDLSSSNQDQSARSLSIVQSDESLVRSTVSSPGFAAEREAIESSPALTSSAVSPSSTSSSYYQSILSPSITQGDESPVGSAAASPVFWQSPAAVMVSPTMEGFSAATALDPLPQSAGLAEDAPLNGLHSQNTRERIDSTIEGLELVGILENLLNNAGQSVSSRPPFFKEDESDYESDGSITSDTSFASKSRHFRDPATSQSKAPFRVIHSFQEPDKTPPKNNQTEEKEEESRVSINKPSTNIIALKKYTIDKDKSNERAQNHSGGHSSANTSFSQDDSDQRRRESHLERPDSGFFSSDAAQTNEAREAGVGSPKETIDLNHINTQQRLSTLEHNIVAQGSQLNEMTTEAQELIAQIQKSFIDLLKTVEIQGSQLNEMTEEVPELVVQIQKSFDDLLKNVENHKDEIFKTMITKEEVYEIIRNAILENQIKSLDEDMVLEESENAYKRQLREEYEEKEKRLRKTIDELERRLLQLESKGNVETNDTKSEGGKFFSTGITSNNKSFAQGVALTIREEKMQNIQNILDAEGSVQERDIADADKKIKRLTADFDENYRAYKALYGKRNEELTA